MEVKFKDRVGGFGLYSIYNWIKATCRYQVNGQAHFDFVLSSGKPFVLASWHGLPMMVAPLISKLHDLSDFLLIMPDDWRGASLYVFTSLLETEPFPMNLAGDTTMAQGRALVKIVRELRNGRKFFINPDGPAGPGYVVKPGLTFIAQKSGAYILPFGGYARHAYRVPRWDMYTVPFPFSRISVQFGEPMLIKPEEDLDEMNEVVTDKLHRVAAQAAANYYEKWPEDK